MCAVMTGPVDVVCTKNGGDWPEGSFTLNVTASSTVGGLSSCSDTKSLSGASATVVTVNKLPAITISTPAWATASTSGTTGPAVCSTDTEITFSYRVNTGTSGLRFAASVPTNSDGCTITVPANAEDRSAGKHMSHMA